MSVKSSKYNIFVDHDGKVLLFNGLSGALLALPKPVGDIVAREGGCDDLEEAHPELFQSLVQTRCLVDEGLDELAIVKKRSRNAVYEDKNYHLTINPTMNCNFKCWYCFEGHVKSKMSPDVADRVKRHVDRMAAEAGISGVQLGWFGGEPMMTFSSIVYPLSLALKQFCRERNLTFSNGVTTNAYLLTPKHVDFYREIDLNFFQITLDGSRERHNKVRFLKKNERPTYDRIVENINMLAANLDNVQILLRINFQNETFETVRDIIGDFSPENRKKIKVDFQRVWQTVGSESIVEDQLKNLIDDFKSEGFIAQSASNKFMLFQGKKCYADRWYQAAINYDGHVFKCTARDFTPANAEGRLAEDGRIEWRRKRIDARFARAPWERERCMDCQLLPLCMGPCTQQMLEVGEANRNNHCWLDNLELKVEDYVIQRYQAARQRQRQTVSQPIAV